MTRSLRSQIEDAWFGPGAACDVAAKLNETLPAPKRISPDQVRRVWSQMQLGFVERPANGWNLNNEKDREITRLLRQAVMQLARKPQLKSAQGRAA